VRAEQIVGAEDELVNVGVGMAPVDETFSPVAGGQFARWDGNPFEIEDACEAEPAERAGAEQYDGLDDPDLAQAGPAGHRVGVLVGDDRLRPDPRPRRLLARRPVARHQRQQGHAEPGARQSDSATAARTGATAARR
jgi:hypothetical protein